MTRKLSPLIAVVLSLSCAGSAHAESGGASSSGSSFDCSNLPSIPTDASETVKAAFSSIKDICAQVQLKNANALLERTKTDELAKALAGFKDIQGTTGAISNPENAAHIGDWLAQRLSYKAGMRIGAKLTAQTVGPARTKVVLAFDQSPAETRAKLRVALDQLAMLQTALVAANEAASRTSPSQPPGGSGGPRLDARSAAAILALVPAVFDAAKSISSVIRPETTISAISVRLNPAVLAAGISHCASAEARGNLVVPGIVAIRDTNKYRLTRKGAERVADVTRARLAEVSSQIEKDKAAGKDVKALTLTSQILEAPLKPYDNYVASLASSDEALLLAAETFGDDSATFVYVTGAAFGASGGTVKRTFGADKFQYRATLQLVYQVVRQDGSVTSAGEVPLTDSREFSAGEFLKTLGEEPKEVECPA